MDENEELIVITAQDVVEANQLSLHCPICAGAVEQNAAQAEMTAVYCTACETLYHKACWDRNGSKCAVLGCSGTSYRPFGTVDLGPVLTVGRADIPRDMPTRRVAPNGRTRRLKEDERRLQRELKRRSFIRDLWHSLLRAIKLWPSDPS
jgi:hypothetical protein